MHVVTGHHSTAYHDLNLEFSLCVLEIGCILHSLLDKFLLCELKNLQKPCAFW